MILKSILIYVYSNYTDDCCMVCELSNLRICEMRREVSWLALGLMALSTGLVIKVLSS